MTQGLKLANVRGIEADIKKLGSDLVQAERALAAQKNVSNISYIHMSVVSFVEGYGRFLILNTSEGERNLGLSQLMDRLQRALKGSVAN